MRFRLTAAAALLLFVLGLIVGSPAHAQTSKGILAGVARDESGAVIPNATLTATNQDTGETRTTATLKDGAYRIEALLPPGPTPSPPASPASRVSKPPT